MAQRQPSWSAVFAINLPQDTQHHELWELLLAHGADEALCYIELNTSTNDLTALMWLPLSARAAAYASDDLHAGGATLRRRTFLMTHHDPAASGSVAMLRE